MRFIKILVFIFLGGQQANAIVNGQVVNFDQKPEVINLILSKEELKPEQLIFEEIDRNERCGGIALNDHDVLTAGHCIVTRQGTNQTLIYSKKLKNGTFKFVQSIGLDTNYVYEEISVNPTIGPIPGCQARKLPVLKSKTLDLGVVHFPPGTFQHWADLDFSTPPKIGESLEFYGYGTPYSSFESMMPSLSLRSVSLRKGTGRVWRLNEQRIAHYAKPDQPYADLGDSGSPVYFKGKVIGIINTVQEKCETEYGSDYGFTNTITYLSSPQVRTAFEPGENYIISPLQFVSL